ncbi:MAG: VCBS repeat-containing protein [Candidatus Cloacimonetes bacterium]|nr:VCBS repeat-containing protein [Candidatus Cloacimonadota bacterium]
MKDRLVLFLFLMLTAALFSTAQYTVEFENLQLSGITYENRLPMIDVPGNPCLPYKPIQILIPQNMELNSLSITKDDFTVTDGVEVNYVRTQQTISNPQPDNTGRNNELYSTDAVYPSEDFRIIGTQTVNGFKVATIALYPYRYNPVQKELIVYNKFTVQPQYIRSEKENNHKMLSFDDKVINKVSNMVINPEGIREYTQTNNRIESTIPTPSEPYDMIIITGEAQATWFEDYAQWRTDRGVLTGIVSVQNIYTEYDGLDHADQLRNYIIDAYQTYTGTANPLKYVLLGGDDEIIPIRGVYGRVGDTVDNNMPSDLYYACLDGTWDDNANGIYGEIADNVDFYPEISIGRIPAETEGEFNNFFNKVYHYVDVNSYSNNKACMFGENLNMNPVTWGGDYKDEILDRMPDTYQMETLYQREGTFSRETVMEAINGGVNVMNHMGHANQSFLMGMVTSNISALTNTEFGFLFSQGCYPAAFDEATSLAGESIAENLVFRPGGLMAFIGNTRYGWYYPGSTNGASQYYDRSFFDALYEENIRELGDAHTFCLTDNVVEAMQNDVMRWCYFELILFGDPSIQVKDPIANMPNLEVTAVSYSDAPGDDDGNINPGETIIVVPTIHNMEGWSAAEQVVAEIIDAESPLIIGQGTINIGQVPANGTVENDNSYFTIVVPFDVELRDYNITISLKAFSNGNEIFNRSFESSFNINLVNGDFPWFTGVSSKSAPVVIDYDHDGFNEILYADTFGNITIVNHHGVQIDSLTSARTEDILASFAVGDLDEDGFDDFVFASRLGNIYAIDYEGNYIFDYTQGGMFIKNPVLADINNDGHLETIAMDLQMSIHVLDNQGNPLSGFPLLTDYGAGVAAAVADLDNDGDKEFIIGGSTGMLYAYNYQGVIANGFPVNLGSAIKSSPTVIDNNSIVVATATEMYVIASDGTIEATMAIPNLVASSVIAADFFPGIEGVELAFVTSNGDVFLTDRNLNVMNGFPFVTGMLHSWPPLAGDVDSDGRKDLIVVSQTNNVLILHRDGTPFVGFPYNLRYNGHLPAQLTDLDSDGDLDIVCGVDLGIMVVDSKRPYTGFLDWMIFRGDLKRSGNFNMLDYVDNQEETQLPLYTDLENNYPNPFNPVTNISFTLAESQEVELTIYNIKGQKITTLLHDVKSAGRHTVVWDGTDDNAKSVSSGIYFYRLKTSGKSMIKKMSLIK